MKGSFDERKRVYMLIRWGKPFHGNMLILKDKIFQGTRPEWACILVSSNFVNR